jgi:cytochrome c peroxidase
VARTFFLLRGTWAPALCLLLACDRDHAQPKGEREIELQFDVKVGAERVRCGQQLSGLGVTERAGTLKDLRFFVHDLALIDTRGRRVPIELPDDGRWQFRNVALLDFEDATAACSNGSLQTNARIVGTIPEGRYRGLSFRVGVPEKLSHGDPSDYRPPLTNTALRWDWLGGYKHLRLDLALDETGAQPPAEIDVHLGADQCDRVDGEFRCARENTPAIELATFDADSEKVVLDLGPLLAQLSLEHRPDDDNVPGCMSKAIDPDCEPLFAAFGLSLDGSAPAGRQSVFKVEAREEDDPPRGSTDEDAGGMIEESNAGSADAGEPYDLERPSHFPEPFVPEINSLTKAKVELGRHLFYDKRLSANQTQSCASCHKQALAFTDGRAVGLGSTGESHSRGAMSLANVVYSTTFTWVNPLISDLELQSQVPLFGEKPVELGMSGKEDELAERLRADPKYRELFAAAFPGESEPFNKLFVARAIASFERTLISGNSAYDRYFLGDESALSESAKRGKDMFFDNKHTSVRTFECFHCHGGPTFSDQLTDANQKSGEAPYHNTGLYSIGALYEYPPDNPGLFEFTGKQYDRGRFKAPTLRNIAVTAPYMHDGSIATLEEVIEHYARGGRNVEGGKYVGDGKESRWKSTFVHGFSGASQQEKADLVEFLKSLTDEEFLTNPKHSDPWAAPND